MPSGLMITTKSAPVCRRTSSAYGSSAADGAEISWPAGYVAVTAATTVGAAATVVATAVTRSPVCRSVSASVSQSSAASAAPMTTTRITACSSEDPPRQRPVTHGPDAHPSPPPAADRRTLPVRLTVPTVLPAHRPSHGPRAAMRRAGYPPRATRIMRSRSGRPG